MSTLVSKNPHHRIKSSMFYINRTWNAGIEQATLADERQQQLRPACMSRGMYASAKGHRRRAIGSFSQGLCDLGKKF